MRMDLLCNVSRLRLVVTSLQERFDEDPLRIPREAPEQLLFSLRLPFGVSL